MITVGIIANPASGKDIRRLVAHGSVFDNDEKVSIVRRVLLGLEAVGVERVWIMPDSFGIGPKALHSIEPKMEVSELSMKRWFNQGDSMQAAAIMAGNGAGCIVVLGGDGTNRAVAKGCGDTPLMPISTGTNNVFPEMIEGTIAGLAAGLVAAGLADEAVRPAPRIDITRPDAPEETPDLALVDAAVYAERFIGSRAVWDESKIKELALTRAEPGNIGLSAIGAHALGGDYPPGHGLYLRLGPEGRPVTAPIAPGLMRTVQVVEQRLLSPGEEVLIQHAEPCVLAVDGEREIELRANEVISLRFNPNGPWVVNPRRAIEIAARAGVFSQKCLL